MSLGGGGTLAIVYNGGPASATTHAIFDVTGYFVAGSKSNQANLAAAANDQDAQETLCQGLNYTNMHLYASSLADQFANLGRRNAWINAINAMLAAPPAWLPPTTTAFAQHVLNALNHVRVPPL